MFNGTMNRAEEDRLLRRGKDRAKLIKKGKVPDDTFPVFEIDLPLATGQRPDLVQRAVEENQGSYASAYLEAIGATPSKSNAHLVSSNQPLPACDVFTVAKSAGWKMDALKVRPFSKFAKGGLAQRRAAVSKRFAEHASQNHAEEAGQGTPTQSAQRKRQLMLSNDDDRVYVIANTRHTLSDVKRKYLYPFNAAQSKASASSPRETPLAMHPVPLRHGGEDTAVADIRDMILQLRQPLRVVPKDISVAQKDFVLAFPFESLVSSMDGVEESSLRKQVLSLKMTRLIGLFCHYCYWRVLRHASADIEGTLQHFPPSSDDEEDEEEEEEEEEEATDADETRSQTKARDAGDHPSAASSCASEDGIDAADLNDLATALLASFADIEAPLRDGAPSVGLHRPLTLLCLRVVTESILRSEYPLWFQLEEQGLSRLQEETRPTQLTPLTTSEKIDSLVAMLFDPNRVGSRIAPLESSLSAVHLSSQVQRFFDSAGKYKTGQSSLGATLLPAAGRDSSQGRDQPSLPPRAAASDAAGTAFVSYPRRAHAMAHTTSTYIRQLYPSPRAAATRYMFARARGAKAGGDLSSAPRLQDAAATPSSSVRRVHNQRQLYRAAMERLTHKYSQRRHAAQAHRLRLLASLDTAGESQSSLAATHSQQQRKHEQVVIPRKPHQRKPTAPPSVQARHRRGSMASSSGTSLSSTRSAARLMFLQRNKKDTVSAGLQASRAERERRAEELLQSMPLYTVSRSPFLDPEQEGSSDAQTNGAGRLPAPAHNMRHFSCQR